MTRHTLRPQAIDALKARVDLVDLLAAHGVQVKNEGKGYKATCPWHEDKTPSLSEWMCRRASITASVAASRGTP